MKKCFISFYINYKKLTLPYELCKLYDLCELYKLCNLYELFKFYELYKLYESSIYLKSVKMTQNHVKSLDLL